MMAFTNTNSTDGQLCEEVNSNLISSSVSHTNSETCDELLAKTRELDIQLKDHQLALEKLMTSEEIKNMEIDERFDNLDNSVTNTGKTMMDERVIIESMFYDLIAQI